MGTSTKPWFSKGVWLGIIIAASPFLPVVGTWVQANSATVSLIWGGLAVLVRLITKDRISLGD